MNGTPFGRYELLERLAEGGMAQVYRAVLRGESGFVKQLALKRMLRELSVDAHFVARFVDEAAIASTLSHSNIVQVFDFGQVDGEHYLAMELVDGPSLATLIAGCSARGLPFGAAAALFVGAAMCRGLGAAHRRVDEHGRPAPVVHRDVSPQNVLVSRAGEVKVADFGIAKAAEKLFRTRTGMLVGKCRYMAPEQARGDEVDPRTDVFAAGAVVHELLTGAPLFGADSPEQIIADVLRAEIPPPSLASAHLPAGLDEVLLRALARDPAQRYADGEALARELERLLRAHDAAYSCEGLAALVERLAPHVGGAESSAAEVETTQADTPLAFAPTAISDAGVAAPLDRRLLEAPTELGTQSGLSALATIRREHQPPTAAAPAPPGGSPPAPSPSATTAPITGPVAPSAAALPAAPGTLTAYQAAALGVSRPRRFVLLLALAAIVGVAFGGVGALLLGRAAGDDGELVLPLREGASARRGPWTVRIHRTERGPAGALRVTVDLHAASGGLPGAAGSCFALRHAAGTIAPRFWVAPREHGAGRWLIAFALPSAGPADPELVFAAPAAQPPAGTGPSR